jgi:predicted AAA+ superfamily ATPase
MLLKSDIKKIWELQRETVSKAETGVPREVLSDFVIPAKQTLILTGIRRCGKSTLLYQLIAKKYPEAFYLNFDDNRLYGFDNSDLLRLDEVINETSSRVLFFDEIQEVDGWERYVRQKLDENYKVVITGSNASLLNHELGTKLTGRHLNIELFPFSYNEFLKATKMKGGEESVTSYMNNGGFPEYLSAGREEILSDLFEDILIRDIVVRYGIRDIKGLQRLALWLISNTGNRLTGSKLKQTVGISATSTIMEYFSHLESVYLFHFVPCFSYSVRSQMITPRKLYSADNGLITVNSASFTDDRGRKLENIIYTHLRLAHKSVFYFSGKSECDFIVIRKGKKPLVFQSCHTLDRDNLDREIGGLYEALTFFKQNEGIIVTLNQTDIFRSNGLTAHVIPVWEFLEKQVVGSRGE